MSFAQGILEEFAASADTLSPNPTAEDEATIAENADRLKKELFSLVEIPEIAFRWREIGDTMQHNPRTDSWTNTTKILVEITGREEEQFSGEVRIVKDKLEQLEDGDLQRILIEKLAKRLIENHIPHNTLISLQQRAHSQYQPLTVT